MSPNPSPSPAPAPGGGPNVSLAQVLAALNGMSATAKQAATPLEALKQSFSELGAAMMGTLDPTGKVREAFAGLKGAMGGLKDALALAGPRLADLGKAFLNVVGDMGSVAKKMLPSFDALKSAFKSLANSRFADELVSAVQIPLLAVGRAFKSLANSRFADEVLSAFVIPIDFAKSAIQKLGPVIVGFGTKLWEHVGPPVKAVGEFIGATFGAGTALANVGVKLVGAFASGIRFASQFGAAVTGMLAQMAEGGATALRRVFGVLDSGISAVNMNVTRFVKMVDPAAIVRWELAVDTLYATIGSALIPVLNIFTEVVKNIGQGIAGTSENGKMLVAALAAGTVGLVTFGAAMAAMQAIMSGGLLPIIGALIGAIGGVGVVTGALEPIMSTLGSAISGLLDVAGTALMNVANVVMGAFMGPLQKAFTYIGQLIGYLADAFTRMGPAIGALFEVFDAVMEAVRPVQEMIVGTLVEGVVLLAEVFKGIAPVLVLVAESVGGAIRQMISWARELMAIIGINIPEFTKADAPQGQTAVAQGPVRQAQFGNVEETLRKAMASAYTIGGGAGGEKPEVKIAANTSQTAQAVTDMKAQINEKFNMVMLWLTSAFPDFITKQLPTEVYNRMVQVAKNGINILKDASVEIPGTGGARVSADDVLNPLPKLWDKATNAIDSYWSR